MAMHEFTAAHRDEAGGLFAHGLNELIDDAELEPVQVAAVLRYLQASSLPERGVSIAIEVDESLHVNVDEVRLTLAVGDLLDQAIDTSTLGAQVVMRSRADDDGVVIEVEDESGSTRQLTFPPARPTRLSSWPPNHR